MNGRIETKERLTRRYSSSRGDISNDLLEELGRSWKSIKIDGYGSVPKHFQHVRKLNPIEKKSILVSGGAGFVGSHLVDRLMLMGHNVIVVDNFLTGSKDNILHWMDHPNFELLRHDIVEPLQIEVDYIYHLACPASPVHYQTNPIKTLKTAFIGTLNMLGLAKRTKSRILIASTSEVYGDPEVHPQKEDYNGSVSCTGPRACYDEGKRAAEALAYSFQSQNDVDIRVARIFNTYGPRMKWNDGRVVSNFILQALRDEPMTVYGDGSATRSFQFVYDLVEGLMRLMDSNCTEPVNIGNPVEYSVLELSSMVKDTVKEFNPSCSSVLVFKHAIEDDPRRRRPDISRAKEQLNWSPKWSVQRGLQLTVKYFVSELEENS
ncbi:hypothetical protein CANCADRAFT_30638 [Tortispora caseinolytica NRRL Y-17796]|uniref:UDP-glucuronic acid decarboxylase 1 n=1 Tax=Tortispora caseinolytica NRRL Y-17796 TaxID=767744 RepID=A0A1E4TL70_9ASCO|nr:hypothetical protein CANCADRAFT_30638 [Tortispora caseinolytica NRRL Y-17796]